MAETTFEFELFVRAPRDRVFAFMRYLPNHVLVHPMIEWIEPLDDLELLEPVAQLSPGERSRPRRFRVFDRLDLGPLRWTFPYDVELTVCPPDELRFRATRFPRVRLDNVMRCLEDGAGTRIEERSRIAAPGPMIAYIRRVALAAHTAMFEGIRAHLERERG